APRPGWSRAWVRRRPRRAWRAGRWWRRRGPWGLLGVVVSGGDGRLDGLDLEELLDPEPAVLPAEPRLLVAAERRQPVGVQAVHVHDARTDAAGHGDGPVLVGAEHAGGEAVLGGVRQAHRVVVAGVGLDGDHGAEDLLAGDPHLRRDPAEDDRREVEAALGQGGGRVAVLDDGALVDRGGEVAGDPVPLRPRGERP